MVRRGQSPEAVAEQMGMSTEEVMAGIVHALRRAACGGEPSEMDARLGELILTPRPHAERHHGLQRRVLDGADPIDADLIVRAAGAAGSQEGRTGTGAPS